MMPLFTDRSRIFVCENIPQLKYHNPKLKVDVKLLKGTASPATIRFNTGELFLW